MNNFSTLFKPRALARDLTIHLVMAPTVFKNKLFTKVDARTNGLHHENHCIKRHSHL